VKRQLATVALLTLGCAPSLLHGQVAGGSKPEGSLSLRLAELGIEVVGRWSPNPSTELIYAVRRVGQGEGSSSELLVLDSENPSAAPLFSMAMPLQLPVACYPIQGSGDLITVWSTGTASVEVIVLSFDSGRVRQVLNEGADWLPEVVIGSGGEPYILLTYLDWKVTPEGRHLRFPKEVAVYRWNGKGYDARGRVPFARRLEVLGRSGTSEPARP